MDTIWPYIISSVVAIGGVVGDFFALRGLLGWIFCPPC